jgi:hypothetical protein
VRRELGQLSLADGLVEGGAGRNRQLAKIGALVDWASFERLPRALHNRWFCDSMRRDAAGCGRMGCGGSWGN